LREKGNSLVIVEHDEETMRRADHIIDLGPAPECMAGRCRARNAGRDPGAYELGDRALPALATLSSDANERRSLGDVEQWIEIHGAHANNLKNVDARFPVNRLSVITGISGSGKST
jgi:excinuclease ABC subunit A